MSSRATETAASEDRGEGLDLNLTPMIDVIFQLLIFFMCTMQFKALEGKLLSHLPRDGANVDLAAGPIPEIDVYLERDLPTGRTTWRLGTRTCSGPQDLAQWARRQYDIQRPLGPSEPRVQIHADLAVPFRDVMAVLDRCRELDMNRVVFETPAAATAER